MKVENIEVIARLAKNATLWCNTVGLSYKKGRATLAEMLDAYRVAPRKEARLAMAKAIITSRREACAKISA